jgi:hypothetical protein
MGRGLRHQWQLGSCFQGELPVGTKWTLASFTYLLAGERRKLPVGVADLINGGLKEKARARSCLNITAQVANDSRVEQSSGLMTRTSSARSSARVEYRSA